MTNCAVNNDKNVVYVTEKRLTASAVDDDAGAVASRGNRFPETVVSDACKHTRFLLAATYPKKVQRTRFCMAWVEVNVSLAFLHWVRITLHP